MKKLVKIALSIVVLLTVVVAALEIFSSYKPSKTIHQNAPVKTKQVVRINAPLATVYQVFTDVNNWPTWQKEISAAKINGPLQAGTTIDWKSSGLNITSALQTVTTGKIGWAGKAFGAFAIHVWTFEQHHGYTTVTVEESMEGWLVNLMKGYFQSHLVSATQYWLNALKSKAENTRYR